VQLPVAAFEQYVRQNRNGVALFDDPLNSPESFQKNLFFNGEIHARLLREGLVVSLRLMVTILNL
jgi:hypothetical protein